MYHSYSTSFDWDVSISQHALPSTLTSANNLAHLYSDQGKYDEAAVLYKRSFAGSEKALGPDHPDTLTSANNLTMLYSNQGKYDEAAVLYKCSFAY